MADRPTQNTTRRGFLAAAAASAAFVPMTRLRAETRSVGAQMLERARSFVSGLSGPQRESALFPFRGRQHLSWNFMRGSARAPGVALEQMNGPQKDAALDLLQTGLSPLGFEKARNIMLQQDILRDEWGKGSRDRNRERFSTMIFGEPSDTALWGWRFEGHHLSLSFTLRGTEVASLTPSSFSSEPNTAPSGPHRGLVVLQEEALGRAIFGDLSASEAAAARLRDRSYGNILTTAGREERVAAREGLALGDLAQGQIDRVLELAGVFAVENFAAPLAALEQARLREGDVMAARFGWAGDNREGRSIYYRLHGDTFLMEFATLRNQPQHHHGVRHDFERNLGAHIA